MREALFRWHVETSDMTSIRPDARFPDDLRGPGVGIPKLEAWNSEEQHR